MVDSDSTSETQIPETVSRLWETLNLDETDASDLKTSIRPPLGAQRHLDQSASRVSTESTTLLIKDITIKEVIGRGGMGVVKRARQQTLNRDVAVKLLHENASSYAEEALIREAQIMGYLEHPNIIPVHALMSDADHRPSMVMKRVEGNNWQDMMYSVDHPGWSSSGAWAKTLLLRNIEVILEISKAVGFAHSRGIIHRDLKPANMMIGSFGEVYLLDWGIALKLSEQHKTPFELVGTPAYMSPEQVNGEQTFSVATDIYLLGACLYEVITGSPPHARHTLRATLESAFACEPLYYSGDTPSELADICNRAMNTDPGQRFRDTLDFRAALKDFISHQSSIRLANTADALLNETLAGDSTKVRPDTATRLKKAEFAYEQARIDWPENPAAIIGLQKVFLNRCRGKMAVNNIESAREDLQLLEALPLEIHPELSSLYADTKETLSELESQKKDEDPRTASRDRVLFLLVLMSVVSVGSLFQVESIASAFIDYDVKWLFDIALVYNAVLLVGLFLIRKRLLVTSYGRRAVAIELIVGGIILLHRGACLGLDVKPDILFAGDMVILSCCALFCGLYLRKSMGFWAIPWMITALLMPLFPGHGGVLFNLASLASVAMAVATKWMYKSGEHIPAELP